MAATLSQIYDAMIDIEQAELVAVDAGFTSLRRMPSTISAYPVAFRLPAKGYPTGLETSGQPGRNAIETHKPLQFFMYELRVAILVGPSSNEIDPLDELASAFIQPFYDTYYGHNRLFAGLGDGAIEYMDVGVFEMGEYKPRDTGHYGVIFPVFIKQRINRAIGP